MISYVLALLLAGARPAELPRAEIAACVGTPDFSLNVSKVATLRAAATEAQWRDACRQARDANDRRLRLIAQLLATGRSPLGGYPSTSNLLEKARGARDPVVADLLRRTARDQAARESLSPVQKRLYAPGLGPLADALLNGLISHEAVRADAGNQAWLGRAVALRGWFTISRDGEAADQAAWLIVQHSDANRPFQKGMIDLLEPLASRGETSPNRFAFLYDRWAAGVGAPQRYGLQGGCVGSGAWEPRPLERPADVDRLREQAGLPPLDEHVAAQSRTCR